MSTEAVALTRPALLEERAIHRTAHMRESLLGAWTAAGASTDCGS